MTYNTYNTSSLYMIYILFGGFKHEKNLSIFPIELDEIWDGAVELLGELGSWFPGGKISVESDQKTKKNDDLIRFKCWMCFLILIPSQPTWFSLVKRCEKESNLHFGYPLVMSK